MKIITMGLLIFCSMNAHAQKDRTEKWSWPQKGDSLISLNLTSKKVGGNFYDVCKIVPRTVKTLHLNIRALSSLDSGELKHPYILRVEIPGGAILNELVENQPVYQANFNLVSTDTVSVICTTHPLDGESVKFYMSYIIGDTAQLSYTGQRPQDVFDKMLQLAGTGYLNSTIMKGADESGLIYTQGLFAPLPAVRSSVNGKVVQNTGEGLDRLAANKIIAKWNRQIKEWLNEYAVTDIKTTGKGNPDQNTDEEETVYTKTNEKGVVLFKVSVFKVLNGTGNATSTARYATGVRIGLK